MGRRGLEGLGGVVLGTQWGHSGWITGGWLWLVETMRECREWEFRWWRGGMEGDIDVFGALLGELNATWLGNRGVGVCS